MPFATMITDVTGIPLERRRNGGTSIGYFRRASLRREQCDMMPDSLNCGVRRDAIVSQRQTHSHG